MHSRCRLFIPCPTLESGRFVQTRPLIGLSAVCTQKCIDVLNTGPPIDEVWWNEVDGGRDGTQDLSRSMNALTFCGMAEPQRQFASPAKAARTRELPETTPVKSSAQARPRTAPSKRAAAVSPKKQPVVAPLLVRHPDSAARASPLLAKQSAATESPSRHVYASPSKQPAASPYGSPLLSKQSAGDRYASPLLASPEARPANALRRRVYAP